MATETKTLIFRGIDGYAGFRAGQTFPSGRSSQSLLKFTDKESNAR